MEAATTNGGYRIWRKAANGTTVRGHFSPTRITGRLTRAERMAIPALSMSTAFLANRKASTAAGRRGMARLSLTGNGVTGRIRHKAANAFRRAFQAVSFASGAASKAC